MFFFLPTERILTIWHPFQDLGTLATVSAPEAKEKRNIKKKSFLSFLPGNEMRRGEKGRKILIVEIQSCRIYSKKEREKGGGERNRTGKKSIIDIQ